MIDPHLDAATSTDRRAIFADNGFIVVPSFFDGDQIEQLRQMLDDASSNDGPRHPLDRDAMHFHSNLFRRSEAIAGFVTQPAIRRLLMDLVDDELWVRWDQRVVKGPGGPAFPWHQDNAYNHLPCEHIQLWIVLTSMDSSNGGLWLDPGSHRAGRRRHRREGSHAIATRAPQHAVAITATPGDVVVFSSFMLHHTTPNKTARDRDAYVVEYLATHRDDPQVDGPYLIVDETLEPMWFERRPHVSSARERIRNVPLHLRRLAGKALRRR